MFALTYVQLVALISLLQCTVVGKVIVKAGQHPGNDVGNCVLFRMFYHSTWAHVTHIRKKVTIWWKL